MKKSKYTSEVVAESEHMYNVLINIQTDKKLLISMMVEAFINGMNAQEQLITKKIDRLGLNNGNFVSEKLIKKVK